MKKDTFTQFITENVLLAKKAYNLRWVYIRISFVSKTDYYMAMRGHFPIPFLILYVDYSARKLGKKAIVGILAHELAHYFTSDERRADALALQAGFKENLVAFHIAHNRKYEAFEKHEGMTLSEIQKWEPKLTRRR